MFNLNWGMVEFPLSFAIRYHLQSTMGFNLNGVPFTPSNEASSWNYYPEFYAATKFLKPIVIQGSVSGFRGGLGSRDVSASGSLLFVVEHFDV